MLTTHERTDYLTLPKDHRNLLNDQNPIMSKQLTMDKGEKPNEFENTSSFITRRPKQKRILNLVNLILALALNYTNRFKPKKKNRRISHFL